MVYAESNLKSISPDQSKFCAYDFGGGLYANYGLMNGSEICDNTSFDIKDEVSQGIFYVYYQVINDTVASSVLFHNSLSENYTCYPNDTYFKTFHVDINEYNGGLTFYCHHGWFRVLGYDYFNTRLGGIIRSNLPQYLPFPFGSWTYVNELNYSNNISYSYATSTPLVGLFNRSKVYPVYLVPEVSTNSGKINYGDYAGAGGQSNGFYSMPINGSRFVKDLDNDSTGLACFNYGNIYGRKKYSYTFVGYSNDILGKNVSGCCGDDGINDNFISQTNGMGCIDGVAFTSEPTDINSQLYHIFGFYDGFYGHSLIYIKNISNALKDLRFVDNSTFNNYVPINLVFARIANQKYDFLLCSEAEPINWRQADIIKRVPAGTSLIYNPESAQNGYVPWISNVPSDARDGYVLVCEPQGYWKMYKSSDLKSVFIKLTKYDYTPVNFQSKAVLKDYFDNHTTYFINGSLDNSKNNLVNTSVDYNIKSDDMYFHFQVNDTFDKAALAEKLGSKTYWPDDIMSASYGFYYWENSLIGMTPDDDSIVYYALIK